MRLCLALALMVSPLHAREFSTDPVCTIWHQTLAAEMKVTYDPRLALPYSIAVQLTEGAWPSRSPNAIRFDGPNQFTITTDRHLLSDDGSAVIASDTGFGNGLNGLEFNLIAVAMLGGKTVAIPLTDAAASVRKFRDCLVTGLS